MQTINYSALLNDEEEKGSDESDGDDFDNLKSSGAQTKRVVDSDIDEPIAIDSDGSDDTPVKKAPAKRKLGPKILSSPDSTPIKPTAKRKKQISSDDDTPVAKKVFSPVSIIKLQKLI